MKKNRMMRLASTLLVAVLLTTSMISGTFAKYVTEASATDSARVAKWGVTVTVEGDKAAFSKEYAADTTVISIDKTVKASSTDEDDLVAPGTKGILMAGASISGTPEVATKVTKTATLELGDGWVVEGAYYCPLVITVGTTPYNGMDYTAVGDFENAVNGALSATYNLQPNEDLTDNVGQVTWAWPIADATGTKYNQDNKKDTALGDYAAKTGDIKIDFTYGITVEQID